MNVAACLTDEPIGEEVLRTASGTGLAEALELRLTVRDRDTLVALAEFPTAEQRAVFALDALRIGVLALRQARGQLDANAVQRECERMLGLLERHLSEHATQINHRLTGSLKEYFDPETGRFQERVDRLVRRDGELEQLLRRQLGADDSELCKTLLTHVGQNSPLMKQLSPTESQGLLSALRDTVQRQLNDQRETVLREFSLDNEQGSLARLVRQLTDNQGRLTIDLKGKIDDVVKEFSLDEENSALSRLVRNVTSAQQTISREFSLDNEQSALSRLKKMVEATDEAIRGNLSLDDEHSALARLKREMLEILKTHGESTSKFQSEIKATLAAMVAKKEEAARSTQHGLEFELVVCEFFARLAQPAGDTAVATGATTGHVKNCKVGDCVVTLGPDSAAPGAKIVIEAKEKQRVDQQSAIEESGEARKNRGAQVGIFVYSKHTAPANIEPLARFGQDVIVVWDAEDSSTDLYLRAAYTLAKALCVRAATERAALEVDFTKIDEAILEIGKRAAQLDQINGWSETISKNSEKIVDHVRTARKALERQVASLQTNVSDLKQIFAVRGAGEPTVG